MMTFVKTSRRTLLLSAAAAAAFLLLNGGAAHADATSDARRALQTLYDKTNAAAANKDLNGVLAYMTPDFVATGAKGEKRTVADLRAQLAQIFPLLQSWSGASRIQQVTLNNGGGAATVVVKENVRMLMVNPQTKQKAVLESTGVSRDVWVKSGGGGWRMKQSRTLSAKALLNGKPAPGG